MRPKVRKTWSVFSMASGNLSAWTQDAEEARAWKKEILAGEWGDVFVVVTRGYQMLGAECYEHETAPSGQTQSQGENA